MKYHKQLPLPTSSAWEYKTWRYYTPIWFNQFIESVQSIIYWFPIIWKDKQWDYFYIFEILKHKLIFQRKCLINANRTQSTPEVNRDITICLNLIERIQDDYYETEYLDHIEDKMTFVPLNDGSNCSSLNIEDISETLDDYFKKHKSTVKKCLKKDINISENKRKLASAVSSYKQEQCKRLLFEILNKRITRWWD